MTKPATRPDLIEAPPAKLLEIRRLRDLITTRKAAAPRKWTSPGAMATTLDPLRARTTPMLDLVDGALVDLADGDDDRLMIFCPPQEGKSQKVSRRFPAWLLSHDPTLRIGIVSYEAGKAVRWGKWIKQDVGNFPEMGIRIAADSQAAGNWRTIEGGGVICAGIAGGITGEHIDVMIIDDPVRGRREAESQTYRDAAWDWWESNGSTRLSERGKVIVMMTRWHTDDLAGRLQREEPGEWRVVSIPAIAGDADPLGRQPGEELQSVRNRKPGFFRKLADLRSSYAFSSIYQQNPTSAGGNIFKADDWRYWHWGGTPDDPMVITESGHFRLAESTKFITMDLAISTKTSADFTVASAWAIPVSGELLLLDRKRARVPAVDHEQFLAPLRQRWLQQFDIVHVEQSMQTTTLVHALGRKGVPVQALKPDADKLTRALAFADLVTQHRVYLPQGADWLDEWVGEHADFPNVAHDDQVDTGAYAARVAIAHWLPMETAEQERVYEAPADPGYVDLTTANW